jgi:hypothetical protein
MDFVPTVADLVRQLRAFHGYRTLWLDQRRQGLLHAEPDLELEDEGYHYVATLMQPGPEELAEALARVGFRPAPAETTVPELPWSAVSEPASA